MSDREPTPEDINAAVTFLAYSLVSFMIGVASWCFGETSKHALGIGIVIFFFILLLHAMNHD